MSAKFKIKHPQNSNNQMSYKPDNSTEVGIAVHPLVSPLIYLVSASNSQVAVRRESIDKNLMLIACDAIKAIKEASVERYEKTGEGYGLGSLVTIQGGHLDEEYYIATKKIFETMGEEEAAKLLG